MLPELSIGIAESGRMQKFLPRLDIVLKLILSPEPMLGAISEVQ